MSLISKLFLARPERTTAVLSVLTSAFHSGDSKKLMGTMCVVLWRLEKGRSNHNWRSFNLQPLWSFTEGQEIHELHVYVHALMGPKTLILQQIFVLDVEVCVKFPVIQVSVVLEAQLSLQDTTTFSSEGLFTALKLLLYNVGPIPEPEHTLKQNSPNFFCHHLIEFLTPIQILWCRNDCNFK